ncbi:transposase [Chamaesiphon polymorphus]|uniref:Transposase n=1 Tax=Chamaesiphon polymorphus CCALA 037 TaxID=2107692 RepID=A0A2T1FDN7_9CYAN|nr:transposase [Chamaesiphon polymorphus]PSB43071.1 transposase [Chamaesiphon polymorphus CCALA 037]
MKYNPDFHHRQSIRLNGYDYSRSGAYFITICTHDREYLFGEIVNEAIELNTLGELARSHWQQLSQHHPNIIIDESIVMPNHLHGIIILESSTGSTKSISEIIRGFKTFSAKAINKERGLRGIPVWQRNYYDRIIRNELELDRVRQYIMNNPRNWDADKNNQNQPSTPTDL